VPQAQAAAAPAAAAAVGALAAAGHEARTIIDPGRRMARAWPNQQCQMKPKRGSDVCTLHKNLDEKGKMKRGRCGDDGCDVDDAGGKCCNTLLQTLKYILLGS
jgi:hypothetical protein